MKQLKTKFMAMLAIAGVVAFSSCDPEDEGLAGPSITFTTTPAHSDNVVSAEVGAEVSITVNVNAPGGFNVLRASGGIDDQEWLRTEEGQTTYSTTIDLEPIEAAAAGGFLEIEFEAVDDQDSVTTKTLRINVAASPLVSKTSVILFGQSNNDGGSFYNLLDNSVLGYAAARDASGVTSSTVDLAFFYADANLYTLAGINDPVLNSTFSVSTGTTNAITDIFGKKNATRFVNASATISAAEFDAITTGSAAATAVSEALEGATKASRANELLAGNVLVFELDEARGGQTGLIKVVSTGGTAGASRTITINVKYQE